MNTINNLFAFVNLFSIASLYHSSYEMQEKLVAMCRVQKRPFLYQTLVKKQFYCPICDHSQNEIVMHFEDPSQYIGLSTESPFCINPAGRFYDINRSTLHGILAHGNPMPVEFLELITCSGNPVSAMSSHSSNSFYQPHAQNI